MSCSQPGPKVQLSAILLTKNHVIGLIQKKKKGKGKEIELGVVAHTFSPYTEETKTGSL